MNAIYKETIKDFLQLKSIAVLGYSTDKNQPANAIYKKLENNGYKVFAINPKADQIKDVVCYPDLGSISDQMQGAVLCTPAAATNEAVTDCAEHKITHVWIHQGIGPGSYDPQAFETAKKLGMEVIPGGCPMMFVKPDLIHRCMGWFKKLPE